MLRMNGHDPVPVGHLLRDWRRRRRLSQLELALDAQVSARHLSFLETGRSHPSREMVLRLAQRLDVPLRERNRLLGAAGFAPMYAERSLEADAMKAVRAAVERVLHAHEPLPAIAVDRHWNLVLANDSARALYAGVASWLLEPPANVVRLSLHPEGMAHRILDYEAIRHHMLLRLRHQASLGDDPTIEALVSEVAGYPVRCAAAGAATVEQDHGAVVMPIRIRDAVDPDRVLSFIGTITVFGTPADVTVSELAIEAFFPADDATMTLLRQQRDPVS